MPVDVHGAESQGQICSDKWPTYTKRRFQQRLGAGEFMGAINMRQGAVLIAETGCHLRRPTRDSRLSVPCRVTALQVPASV
jgi:hypothetical protein